MCKASLRSRPHMRTLSVCEGAIASLGGALPIVLPCGGTTKEIQQDGRVKTLKPHVFVAERKAVGERSTTVAADNNSGAIPHV